MSAPELDADELRESWAIYRAARGVDGPEAFSAEWNALPVDDVRRRAALVRAAWRWWSAERGLACPAGQRGLEELVDREVNRELRAASHAIAGAEDWSATARDSRYNQAALRRRAEALRPRPGDYEGRPVDWETGRPITHTTGAAA